jgi:hypothetical protein
MRLANALLFTVVILAAGSAFAQPMLDQLWPYEMGKSWHYVGSIEQLEMPTEDFDGRLIFQGTTTMPPGVEVRDLIGQVTSIPPVVGSEEVAGLSPLLRRLWIARPGLRDAIRARADKGSFVIWPALLLGPAEFAAGVGHRETADRIGIWREDLADWSWWWLTGDLVAGSEFTIQLVPDLADDVFLHGTVRGTAESIGTPAGNWMDATIVDYVVDMGTQVLTDTGGNPISSFQSETHGWVAYVPDVGPVASWEEFVYTSVDCPEGCPEEELIGVPLQTVELSLTELPVETRTASWGALKSAY